MTEFETIMRFIRERIEPMSSVDAVELLEQIRDDIDMECAYWSVRLPLSSSSYGRAKPMTQDTETQVDLAALEHAINTQNDKLRSYEIDVSSLRWLIAAARKGIGAEALVSDLRQIISCAGAIRGDIEDRLDVFSPNEASTEGKVEYERGKLMDNAPIKNKEFLAAAKRAAAPAPLGEGAACVSAGMSLRDWFAGMAITTIKHKEGTESWRAAEAYRIADALLSQRTG